MGARLLVTFFWSGDGAVVLVTRPDLVVLVTLGFSTMAGAWSPLVNQYKRDDGASHTTAGVLRDLAEFALGRLVAFFAVAFFFVVAVFAVVFFVAAAAFLGAALVAAVLVPAVLAAVFCFGASTRGSGCRG